MKNTIIILFILFFNASFAQTANETTHKVFDFYPTSTYNQIIFHTYYALSYSEKDEQAEWVAYKLTYKNIDGNIKRTNNFKADKWVKTESAQLSDYYKSGYDRGHLAPAGSMKIDKTSMKESFFMSNMSPQKPGFNRGIWKRLEEKVRYWTSINDSVFVVTGPILDNPLGTIGDNEVTIPRAYYKTLLGYKNGKAKGLAFIMPNEKSNTSLYKFVVSINDVEEITGIDFYHNIDKEVQDKVEKNKDVKVWFIGR
jgi:endonuclease G